MSSDSVNFFTCVEFSSYPSVYYTLVGLNESFLALGNKKYVVSDVNETNININESDRSASYILTALKIVSYILLFPLTLAALAFKYHFRSSHTFEFPPEYTPPAAAVAPPPVAAVADAPPSKKELASKSLDRPEDVEDGPAPSAPDEDNPPPARVEQKQPPAQWQQVVYVQQPPPPRKSPEEQRLDRILDSGNQDALERFLKEVHPESVVWRQAYGEAADGVRAAYQKSLIGNEEMWESRRIFRHFRAICDYHRSNSPVEKADLSSCTQEQRYSWYARFNIRYTPSKAEYAHIIDFYSKNFTPTWATTYSEKRCNKDILTAEWIVWTPDLLDYFLTNVKINDHNFSFCQRSNLNRDQQSYIYEPCTLNLLIDRLPKDVVVAYFSRGNPSKLLTKVDFKHDWMPDITGCIKKMSDSRLKTHWVEWANLKGWLLPPPKRVR